MPRGGPGGIRASRRTHVERRAADHPAPTPQPTPCRLWQGALTPSGYGARTRTTDGARVQHRWVMMQVGQDVEGRPFEVGLDVMHVCDNRLCYRYDHLRVGTRAENLADMVTKRRSAVGSRQGQAKLSEADIPAIRADARPQHEIAAEYGVSQMTVSKIKRGVTWRHVQ